MNTSQLIQFDQALQAAIEAAMAAENLRHPAALQCVYLNRFEEVGENEKLPVIILLSGTTKETFDSGHIMSFHERKITTEIVVNCPQGHNPSVALDAVHQLTRRTILEVGRSFAGIQQLIAPATSEQAIAADGLAVGRWGYDVNQVTYQNDLSLTPY